MFFHSNFRKRHLSSRACSLSCSNAIASFFHYLCIAWIWVSVWLATHWTRWCDCSGSDNYLTGLEKLNSPSWATCGVRHFHVLGWDISCNCNPNYNRKCAGVWVCFGILVIWFCSQTGLESEITLYNFIIKQMLNYTKYSCKFACKYLAWNLTFILHFYKCETPGVTALNCYLYWLSCFQRKSLHFQNRKSREKKKPLCSVLLGFFQESLF